MLQIEPLDWDTALFGYRVGKITIGKDKFDHSEILKLSKDFDLVYIFSDNKIDLPDCKLVDTKVILEKKNDFSDSADISHSSYIKVFDSNTHDHQQLLNLALQSGHYSRFNKDENFTHGEYKKLYTIWIESLLQDKNSQILIISDDTEILGFLGLIVDKGQVVDIALLGVGIDHRGKGMGSALIKKVENDMAKTNVNRLKVTTQLENYPAMKLYAKHGFEINKIVNIYHLWKR